ncbi:hypothetical protein [Streptomyces sp. NPDC002952]|uniref:hypothetical protein n=1 Tax=Streptomyces sp. NPDC002952 TaxID=3364673 RepID=UPI0036A31779
MIGLGQALRSAGLDVLMWAGAEDGANTSPQRASNSRTEHVTAAGLELAHGEMLATATNPRNRLEGVSAVFLLTDDDDFNALASVVIKDNVQGPVYRVGPPKDSHGVVASYTGDDILFGTTLVRHRLAARHEHGARFHVQPGSRPIPPDQDVLFVVRADGRLAPATGTQMLKVFPGDTAVLRTVDDLVGRAFSAAPVRQGEQVGRPAGRDWFRAPPWLSRRPPRRERQAAQLVGLFRRLTIGVLALQ